MNGINSNHCGSIAVLTVVFLSLNDPHICRDETNPCMRTENKHMYTDSTEILYSCMILLFFFDLVERRESRDWGSDL